MVASLRNHWPGPDDKLVVTQMLTDPYSLHWSECRKFFEQVMRVSNLPEDFKEDVVQNAMLTVSRSLPVFLFKCRLSTWLVLVARSRIADAQREQARDKQRITPPNDPPTDEENETGIFKINAPQTTEEACITREMIREAMRVLQEYVDTHANPERNKQIVQKVLLEQYTIEEAAKELGVNAPVVRYIVRSVQRCLRERIESQPPA